MGATPKKIVRDAFQRIKQKENWLQGSSAADEFDNSSVSIAPTMCKFDIYGALKATVHTHCDEKEGDATLAEVFRIVANVIRDTGFQAQDGHIDSALIMRWNDARQRTHEDVMKLEKKILRRM